MEHLNSVTIRGVVGNVRVQPIGNSEMARFSVATDYTFVDRLDTPAIETTWHQVVAFKNDRMPGFSEIVMGAGALMLYAGARALERILPEEEV